MEAYVSCLRSLTTLASTAGTCAVPLSASPGFQGAFQANGAPADPKPSSSLRVKRALLQKLFVRLRLSTANSQSALRCIA